MVNNKHSQTRYGTRGFRSSPCSFPLRAYSVISHFFFQQYPSGFNIQPKIVFSYIDVDVGVNESGNNPFLIR